jgi:hypothetical protein
VYAILRVHLIGSPDRPIDMLLGLQGSKAYIALPVLLPFLFLAAPDPGIAETERRANPTEVGRKSKVIEQARKYVWAINDSQ